MRLVDQKQCYGREKKDQEKQKIAQNQDRQDPFE